MDFNIRDEQSNDNEQVRAILRAAFPADSESKLVDALRTNGKAIISLVAAANGDQVLGHILFSPVSTTLQSDAKGIGSQLIHEGLCLCEFSKGEMAHGLVRYIPEFALFSV